MKNLIMIALILIGTIGFAQTPLTKVSFEDQEALLISSFSGNDNVSWTTSMEHKYFNAGDNTIGTLSSCSYGFNNINGSQSATGDTLDITTEYYSLTNGTLIYNGVQVSGIPTNTNMTYKSIAQDPYGSVYVFGNYGGADSYIFKVTAGAVSATYNFSIAPLGEALTGYTEIVYFEHSGGYYLMFIGDIQYGANSHSWAIIDLSNTLISSVMFGNMSLDITDAVWHNDGTTDHLYFSVNNEIFEASSISASLPNNIIYDITAGQTINDFAVTDNGIFYVAATNGIYSSNNSLTIENQEETIGSTLYPNPNNGTFTISNVEEGTTTQILNQAGQIVYETKDFGNLDLNIEVPAGMYFVRLTTETSSKTIKFVKQ